MYDDRWHDVMLLVTGVGGLLGLLIGGHYYPPSGTLLKAAALVWFLGFGLVRCFPLLTLLSRNRERPWE